MIKLINQPNRFLCNQTKEIQRDFTTFAVTFELISKVQITQNKKPVKSIVNIYHIIVNSNQTFIPVYQKKKITEVDTLLLTHSVAC